MSDTDWSVWEPNSEAKSGGNEEMEDINSETIETNVLFDININDLSEYEFIKIMSYFSFKERLILSRVCHKWRHFVEKSFKSESVLNAFTVGSKTSVSEKAICLLIRKCCNVRHIGLNGMFLFESSETTEEEKESSDNIVVTIAANCPHLQTIDFGGLDQFDDYFERNAKYFAKIKKIVSRNIGERALNCIIDSENMESIDICRNDRISRPKLRQLGPKINEMKLIDSEVFDEVIIKELCDGNGKQIKFLSLDIKDPNVLSLICENLIQLKTLEICLYSKDCDFKQFSNLNALNSLELEVMDDSKLKPEDFNDLVGSLRNSNLSDLRVVLSPINNIAINDESLQEIRKNCETIQKLVIKGANSLTGAGMYAIAQLKHIRHLDLKNCLNISDEIEIVITSCPLLRQLILHNCSHITNRTVDAFIKQTTTCPKELFYLDVIDTNVSQESLPLQELRPKNLKLLVEYEDCIYDCDHGWDQQNGYNSGPEEDNDLIDDIDFYHEEEDEDYDDYDDYDDEDIDLELN